MTTDNVFNDFEVRLAAFHDRIAKEIATSIVRTDREIESLEITLRDLKEQRIENYKALQGGHYARFVTGNDADKLAEYNPDPAEFFEEIKALTEEIDGS